MVRLISEALTSHPMDSYYSSITNMAIVFPSPVQNGANSLFATLITHYREMLLNDAESHHKRVKNS